MLQPGQRKLASARRSAADEVWETWSALRAAPRTARTSAYDQHLRSLQMENVAACELAAFSARRVR
jgi:hypothetical protein